MEPFPAQRLKSQMLSWKTIKAVKKSGLQVVSSNWNDAVLASARFKNRMARQKQRHEKKKKQLNTKQRQKESFVFGNTVLLNITKHDITALIVMLLS